MVTFEGIVLGQQEAISREGAPSSNYTLGLLRTYWQSAVVNCQYFTRWRLYLEMITYDQPPSFRINHLKSETYWTRDTSSLH